MSAPTRKDDGVYFRLYPAEKAKLLALATADQRNISNYVGKIVREFLETQPDPPKKHARANGAHTVAVK